MTNESEARGDWSVFKGDEYHLTFAIYALLWELARSVSFYEGNDLRLTVSSGEDVWVQLKSGEEAWTVTQILAGNLLRNFINNAVTSDLASHGWQTRLVSPGPVRADGIRAFANSPENHPDSNRLLDEILAKSVEDTGRDHDTLASIAKTIFGQIAATVPLTLELMQSRIEISVLKKYADPETAMKIIRGLYGDIASLTGNVSRGKPVSTDVADIERRTGYVLSNTPLLNHNVSAACDDQVTRASELGWEQSQCVRRDDATRMLLDFLRSDRTLFVLVGDSGSGKSWAGRDWASSILNSQVRLLLSGYQLVAGSSSLPEITHDALRSYARPDQTAIETWRRFTAFASPDSAHPPAIIFDDLPLPENATLFAGRLVNLCADAKRSGLKIILLTRSAVWRRACSPETLSEYLYCVQVGTGQRPTFSASLEVLSSTEQEALIALRFPGQPQRATSLKKWIRLHGQSLQGNPYRFSLMFSQIEEQGELPTSGLSLDHLFAREIDRRCSGVAGKCGMPPEEAKEVVDAVAEVLFHARKEGTSRPEAIRVIERFTPGKGRLCYEALLSEDLITDSGRKDQPAGQVVFSNPQLGEFMWTKWLITKYGSSPEVVSSVLQPGIDDGIVAAVARQYTNTPDKVASWLEKFRHTDPLWISALCGGVIQRSEPDAERLCPLLTAWASQDGNAAGRESALRTLGQMASISRFARRWIADLYMDRESHRRFRGELVLGYAFGSMPKWAARIVDRRLRRDQPEKVKWATDNKKIFSMVDGAIRPLELIESTEAAQHVRPIYERLREWNQANRKQDIRETLDESLAMIRGHIAMHDENELDRLRVEIVDGYVDAESRRLAARALRPVAHRYPHRVKDTVFSAFSGWVQNRVPILELLWAFVDSDPDPVLDTIERLGYTVENEPGVGEYIYFLARLAKHQPNRVRQALLSYTPDLTVSDERQIIVNGVAFAWWMCLAASPGDEVAIQKLEHLAQLPIEPIEPEWQCFAYLTRVIARLGLMAPDIPGLTATADAEATFYYHHHCFELCLDLFYFDLQEVFRPHASALSNHHRFGGLVDNIQSAITSENGFASDPLSLKGDWRFRVGYVAAEALAELALVVPKLVSVLPDGHGARYKFIVLNRLCEAGHMTEESWKIGTDLCLRFKGQYPVEGRDVFVGYLARERRLPQELQRNQGTSFFALQEVAQQFDVETRFRATFSLQLLGKVVVPDTATHFLHYWAGESDDPFHVALSYVYRCALANVPLSYSKCKHICRCALATLEDAPDSPARDQHRFVYKNLLTYALGEPGGRTPYIQFGDDWVSADHQEAMRLIADEKETRKSLSSTFRLEHLFSSLKSAYVDSNAKVNDNGVSSCLGNNETPVVVILPATRIALNLVALRSGFPDRTGDVERRLHDILRLLSSGYINAAMRPDDLMWRSYDKQRGLVTLFDLTRKYRWSCLPWSYLGHVLLIRGRYSEARDALKHCLKLPDFPRGTKDGVLYNLSCVYARVGEVEECRASLLSIDKLSVSLEHLQTDPDLTSVQGLDWFLDFKAMLKAKDQNDTGEYES